VNRSYNILVCPLDWGLGHAARMIPVVRQLALLGHNIIIGSGDAGRALFRAEIPGLSFISFPGFNPGYSRRLPQYFSLLLKTPALLCHIALEHSRLKRIVTENKIDIILSDNRFGLWHKEVTSVYVTHMPRIPFPKHFRYMEFIGILLHRFIIRKYSFCFIPDLPGEMNLSGRLSHNVRLPDNVRYVGILSRFRDNSVPQENGEYKFRHNTVILSGPEPQRDMLKQKLIQLLKAIDLPAIILNGKPGSDDVIVRNDNIILYNHIHEPEMAEIIRESDCVISRSGYTTIMELISLNCSALLIPTPGQTEQEYLAEYLSERGWFSTVKQNELKEGISFPGIQPQWTNDLIMQSKILLNKSISELLEYQHKKG
jgi:UDP:flavonoid glycosyltransferase YjiC (YdhE family)